MREGYITFIMEDKHPQTVADIPVACKFPDLFYEEITKLLLAREIDFIIDLILGTVPISNTPYRMSRVELRELNVSCKNS